MICKIREKSQGIKGNCVHCAALNSLSDNHMASRPSLSDAVKYGLKSNLLGNGGYLLPEHV